MSDFSPLKELAELAMGETITAADCDGLGYPIYSADTGDAPWNWSSKIRRLNSFGTIVVGARGSIGFPRFPKCDAFGATQTTITVTPNRNRITPEYLYYVLSRLDFKSISAQQAVPMLTVSELSGVQIRNLPIHEQVHIAEILNTLDTAIHETEAIIAKLKAVKQGLLHDLLTRGIDANGELRPPQSEAPHLYKQSPLGWIPKEWQIESVVKACSDVVDCPHSTPHYQDHGVLVARTMHIKDGMFLDAQASRVSERQYRERIARLEPKAGDVIFTREAPVGEAFVIPPGMKICLGQRVMLLRPMDRRLVAEYLLAQIYSGTVKDRIATLTSGTTNPHLNVSEVKYFEIPLPPYAEQQRIAERLRSLELRLQSEMSEHQKLELLKAGLMDDLLTGRVRVTPLLQEAQHA